MSTNFFSDLFSQDRRRRISWRLEHAGLVVVAWVLERLGLDRASAVMGWLWRRLAPLNRRHARADEHLAAAFPEWDAAKRREVLGDMWENLGRTAAETILLPQLLARPDRITWHDADHIFEKVKNGAFFLSLHSGNWEVACVPICRAVADMRAIYKPLRNPLVEAWLAERRRTLYGGNLMPLDRTIALKMKNAARGGAVIAIMADLREDSGIVIDFFGRPALANPFPAMLARKFDLPIVVGRVVRREGVRFVLEAHILDVAHTGDQAFDVETTTRAVHAAFEEWIREYPEQWMWAHRKWL